MEQSQTLPTAEPLELGFLESFSLAAEGFIAENLSTSDDKAVQRFFGERNAELDGMINAGEIPGPIQEQFRNVEEINQINGLPRYKADYHGLAGWANENLGTGFDTDDTEMRQVMGSERRDREHRLANSSGLGEFAGNMWGSLHDPALLAATAATFPITYGAGGSVTSLVLRTALTEGLIGMASEVPIQLDVMDFKERIDSPYTVEDAIQNVLAAGAGSAVLAGAGAALGRTLELRFKGSLDIPADVTPAEAFETVVREELHTNRPDIPRFEAPTQRGDLQADEFASFNEVEIEGRRFADLAADIDAEEDALDQKISGFIACVMA